MGNEWPYWHQTDMAVEENLRKYNPYINKINSDDSLSVLGVGGWGFMRPFVWSFCLYVCAITCSTDHSQPVSSWSSRLPVHPWKVRKPKAGPPAGSMQLSDLKHSVCPLHQRSAHLKEVAWLASSKISMGEVQHLMLNSYWWRTNTNTNL